MARKWTDAAVATGTSVAAGDLILTVSDPTGTPVSKKITVQNLMDSDSVREAIRDHLGDVVIQGGANVTVTHDDPSDTITVAVTSLDGAVIGSATAAAATFTDLTFTGTLTGDVAASNVTSGTFADARIAESNVTQHQGALSITESQISDFGTYANAVHTHAASDITSGTLADARIAESNVTQHQAALSITESQISDFGTYADATHTHDAGDIVSGTLADARVAQSNVTQHESALSITESQISDFGTYATAAAAYGAHRRY